MKTPRKNKPLIGLSLFLLLNLSGCNSSAKFDTVAEGSDVIEASDGDSNKDSGEVTNSSITFSGIDSIDEVTDLSAIINWTHVTGASAYQIFLINGATLSYITSVDAPIATYDLSGLTAGETLTYRVRLIDSTGKNDTNTKNVSITTNLAPAIPSGLALQSPATTPAFDDTPSIIVSGVRSGDTIKLFTDSACSNEVGSSLSSGTTVNITSSILSSGSYSFYANSTRTNTSACSSANVSYEKTSCPSSGYIPVPANATVGAPDSFCIMKYEAKTSSSGPVSIEAGSPRVNRRQYQAWDDCDSLNSEALRADIDSDTGSDGTYALTSNPEWMAIARNVENVDSNWTSGVIGTGCLKRGNVGGTNSCTGGNSGYNGPNPDSGSGRADNGTAQLTLSNGEVIWDFSGNVREWVDWTIGSPLSSNMSQANKPYDASDGSPVQTWRLLELIDTFSAFAPSTSFSPSDPTFGTSYGMGGYYGSTAGGAALRGGAWYDYTNGGAFALALFSSSSSSGNDMGFRCVFRP